MRILNSFLCLVLFLFASCEKSDQDGDADKNKSGGKQTTAAKPPPKPKPTPKPAAPKGTEEKPVFNLQTPNPTPDPKPEPKPLQPGFSRELLAAVENWTNVSPHVFPLKSVRINKDLVFKIYSKDRQAVVGSSAMPSGSEVVAVSLKGKTLTVSPSIEANMLADIDIDQTDFKQGVAYLFELRKWQRRRQQELNAQALARRNTSPPPSNPTTKPRPSSKPTTSKKPSDNSLFEDLPQPGDYGHGKFCICGDCRKKRLAQTGSLK
jgi:hypothetical protein